MGKDVTAESSDPTVCVPPNVKFGRVYIRLRNLRRPTKRMLILTYNHHPAVLD
jgi:hypothetical protein